jgi:hypothetical protein
MTNIGTAEPLPAVQRNPADDDRPLTQQEKSAGSTNNQPQLRIVHSADRVHTPPAADMPHRDRAFPDSDKPPAMLDRTVQGQIGRLLRDVFADVAEEPVPERFVTLLAELEKLENKSREKPR